MGRALFFVFALACGVRAGQPVDAANFSETVFASGFSRVTGIAWATSGADQILFITEQGGTIRVVRNGTLQSTPYATVTPCRAPADSECGLQSIVVDPNYASNGFVYVFVTESGTGTSGDASTDGVQRIHRYTTTSSGGSLVGTSKTAIGPALPTRGMNHNGGGMSIGPDGNLYFGVGNLNNGVNRGGNSSGAEMLASLGSKIGRMTRDGAAVPGNPYYDAGNGITATDYIFARGLRNPFGLRHHPVSGELWLTQVGDRWEQIFVVPAGGNVGWDTENNTSTTNGLLVPKLAYGTNVSGSYGGCLTRGAFYTGTMFPAAYRNNFFFCDYNSGRIMRSVLSGSTITHTEIWITGAGGPVDVATGPDGALYYAERGAVRRVYYAGGVVAPAITQQPANQTVNDGQTATFSVTATGTALTYQWQLSTDDGATWTNIAGATNASYTTPANTLAMSGRRYRAVVDNAAAGNATSNAATLTVNAVAPTISQQPANQTVVEGQTATFSVTAAGYSPLSYQWQQSTDNGATWTNIAGAASTAYTTLAATAAMNGRRYRVVLDNPAAGTVTSGSATLTVTSGATAPAITQNPAGATVTAPATATFTAAASGTAPLAYQWQRRDPGQTAFVDIPGATGASYTTPATSAAMNGTAYRVVVSNASGSATSAAATLTVNGAPAATPVISPPPGTYSGPVTVRMSTPTAGAQIRYTTDGSAVTGTSPLYAGPFQVSQTTTARAAAFAAGMSQSPTASALYTITGNTAYGLPYRETVTGLSIPAQQTGLPAVLSQTGIFTAPGTLTPRPGLVPFGVNSPLWSDGASKSRWIALPGTERIGFSAAGEWTFPAGTVLVKHFDLGGRRVETRVLRTDGAGGGYGSTYRWRADGSDADLVNAPATETIGGQTWYYPSPADCLRCHTGPAGFVLGPKTRQLNGDYAYPGGATDNQIRTWNYLDMFASRVDEGAIPGYARLKALGDVNATLEDRAKSYLDSNCSQCHRPGSVSGRAVFDALYGTPLASQGLVDVVPSGDPLGLTNPMIVASADPARSVLLSRVNRLDQYRMPTLASSEVDQEAVVTLTAWINTLTPGPGPGPGPGPAPVPPPSLASGDGGSGLDEKCLSKASPAPPPTGWLALLALLILGARRRPS